MAQARGEFALHQAVLGLAETLETIRCVCDRAHEENLLLARDGRTVDLACHYAYAMGTVIAITQGELARLRSELALRRTDENADARALAALEAFKRSVKQLQLQQQEEGDV